MDDLKGGEMRSPIWSDDVTHIYRNLQNRQLGPVSVKEPAFGGLQLTIKAPQAPRISAHQSHILGLTPASPQVSQVKLSPHKHFTFILPTNRSCGEVYINTAEQKKILRSKKGDRESSLLYIASNVLNPWSHHWNRRPSLPISTGQDERKI